MALTRRENISLKVIRMLPELVTRAEGIPVRVMIRTEGIFVRVMIRTEGISVRVIWMLG